MTGGPSSAPRDDLDLAVIGMAGRFPGAANVDAFWANLRAGVESITFFDEEELLESGVERDVLAQPGYVAAAPILEDPSQFDAAFFGYAPREARCIDPQHRLFLECAWEALEDAGYDPRRLERRVGVYGGSAMNTYLLSTGLLGRLVDDYVLTLSGSDKDFLTTRVSYKLNLTGPSLAVQTACSTSLVAVHLAAQSLLYGECDMSLAGGVSVRVPQRAGYLHHDGSIFSSDGHCRAFDARASGTIFGSGVGIVVLKRLADARTDGDNIRAVIKGTAVNNDGSAKVNYLAPSVDQQAAAIAEALADAGVDAATISYVETHGTGTQVGDPIEIAALTRAFRAFTGERGFCAVGSVKTNVGHLDAAAGAAGLIKTVLALEHEEIPASLHFEEPNPAIDFASTPFYVNNGLSSWPARAAPRRAGVNALGVGGTNAHVILEEAPRADPSGPSRPKQVLVLSARSQAALERATSELAAHLEGRPELPLADVAFTLQLGRSFFEHRRAIVCSDIGEAVSSLRTLDASCVLTGHPGSTSPDVVFMLSGEVMQPADVDGDLYRSEPLFRETVDQVAELFRPRLGLDLRDVLDVSSARGGRLSAGDDPAAAHAALFAIEYALAALFLSWGVRPQALIGDGVGELVAASLAGILSLGDAVDVVVSQWRQPLGRIRPEPPRLPLVSTASGTWIRPDEATDPDYWAVQPARTRRLDDGIRMLASEAPRLLLEVGPGRTLSDLARNQVRGDAAQRIVASLEGRRSGEGDGTAVIRALGRLFVAGVDIDWAGFVGSERRRRVRLPTYPFERESHWYELDQATAGGAARAEAFSSTAVEAAVAAVWQEVLGIAEVGLHDDFFELGGRADLIPQVVRRINATFQIELPSPRLVDSPTVAELAARIEAVFRPRRDGRLAERGGRRAF